MKMNISFGKTCGLLLSLFGLFLGMPEVSAQEVNGTQQVHNRGFEEYDDLGTNKVEPVGWNSFMHASGGYSNMAQVCLERVTDIRPGSAGSYSVHLWGNSIIGVNANGIITTGRINMGNMTATHLSNNAYTDRSSEGFNFPFTTVPDSLVIWVKYSSGNASSRGQIKAIIHNDNTIQDPGTDVNQSVAIATIQPQKGNGGWVRYSAAFDRSGCGSNDARYILVNINTNREPGGAVADMYVDDLLFVYNPEISISTLSVTSINMRNGAAYIDIPFTVKGTIALNANSAQKSRVVAELSDAAGNFSNAIQIGSIETETGGVINATIPANTPLGTHYKVRLRALDRNLLSEPYSEELVLMRGYTITATADERYGTVKGAGGYEEGSTVTLVAEAFTGYHFDHWEENGKKVEGAGATYSFTANADRRLEAIFAINTYRLTLLTEGQGAVVSPGTTFNHNDRVRLEAVADEGYVFKGYYLGTANGTLLSNEAIYIFNILSDMQVTAVFEKGKVNIDASVAEISEGMGSVSGGGLKEFGSTVELVATPFPYCNFVAWIEGRDTVSYEPTYTFTAQKNRILKALFIQETHTVSVVSNIPGAGIVSGGGRYSAAASNTTIILKAEPNTGYEFLYWQSNDDGTIYEDNPYTALDRGRLSKDMSFTAYFALQEFNISAVAVPAGAGSIEGAGTYPFRTSVSLRARPLDHYNFVAWVRTDHGMLDTVRDNPLVFTIEEGKDRVYRALFELKRHNVRLSMEPSGYGTVSGEGEYVHFDTAILQAQAKTGYEFLYWGTRRGLNITKVSEENPYKVEVLEDLDLVGVFSERRKDIRAVCRPLNAGSISGEGLYAAGEYAVLRAEPAYGYRFSQWEDSLQHVGSKDNNLYLQVKNDTTVYARFSPLRYTLDLMTEGSSAVGHVRIDRGTQTGGFGTMHTQDVYYGDTLRLVAETLKDGYAFIQWRTVYTKDGKVRDSLYSRSSNAVYVVRGDARIVAYFSQNAHHITASVSPEADCGEVLNQGYYRNELWMELEAKPAKGHAFDHWLDAAGNIVAQPSNRLQLQSFNDTSFTAVFTHATPKVDVEIWGGKDRGSVSGERSYIYGDEARLAAKAEYGYVFAGWYEAADTLKKHCLSRDTVYTFTIEENTRLAADFAPDKFSVVVEVVEGQGSVNGTGTYNYLTEAMLLPVPEDGYALKYMLLERGEQQYDTMREDFAGLRVDKDLRVLAYFEPTPYSLQVFSSDSEQGKVETSVPYSSRLGYGTQVALKATAEPNYRFSQWRDRWGKRVSRTAEFTLTMRCDTSVYADFVPENKRFSAEPEDIRKGSVDYSNSQPYGSTVTVEAVPTGDYEFDSWVLENAPEQIVSRSSILSVFITQDTSFTAHFRLKQRELKVFSNNQSAGEVWLEVVQPNDTLPGGRYAIVEQRSKVILHAEPNENYNFSSWRKTTSGSGGGFLGATAVLELTVDDDMEIEAVFEPKLFHVQVAASPAAFGSVQGGGMYPYGAEVTVNAVYGNYVFKGWKTADGWVSDSAEYTFTVNKDTTLTAYLSQDSVRLSVYAGLGGSVVSGGGDYLKGSVAVLQAEAFGRYAFDAWYDLSGNRLSRQNPYTLTLNGSTSVRAGFIPTVVNVGVAASEGGSVSGGGEAVYASSVQVEAVPDAGYRFVRWESENLDEKQAVLPVLSLYVTEDVSLTAMFEPLQFRISTGVSPLGTGTVTKGGMFDYGALLSFEAKADADHVFYAWTKNGEVVQTEAVLRPEVKEDADYVAVFTPKRYNVATSVYPGYGGLSYGDGSYYWGDTARVRIYLYDSVVFKFWNDADFVQVSNSPAYDYIVTHTEIFTASVDAPKPADPPLDPDEPVVPENPDSVSGIRIYPNPVREGEDLHILSENENLKSIRIFSVTGRYILYRKFSEDGVKSARVRLANIQAGCYFYEIGLTGGSRKKGKLIKL